MRKLNPFWFTLTWKLRLYDPGVIPRILIESIFGTSKSVLPGAPIKKWCFSVCYNKSHNNFLKEDLQELLKLLKKHASEDNRRFLEYNVEETGEDGLVVGAATTWMQFSNEQSGKLTYMLEDDDGKFELNFLN